MLILMVLMLAPKPALAHNPWGFEMIGTYMSYSPIITLALVLPAGFWFWMNMDRPVKNWELVVLAALVLITSYVLLLPAMFFMAIMSQLFYLYRSICLLLLVVHIIGAISVSYFWSMFRRKATTKSSMANRRGLE
jgi:hypothetical protein